VEQVRALGARKAERDHAAVEAALARLVDVSRTDENMIPAMLDAAAWRLRWARSRCAALARSTGSRPVLGPARRFTELGRAGAPGHRNGSSTAPFSRPAVACFCVVRGCCLGRSRRPGPPSGGRGQRLSVPRHDFQAELRACRRAWSPAQTRRRRWAQDLAKLESRPSCGWDTPSGCRNPGCLCAAKGQPAASQAPCRREPARPAQGPRPPASPAGCGGRAAPEEG
jgi:hypothetical protein